MTFACRSPSLIDRIVLGAILEKNRQKVFSSPEGGGGYCENSGGKNSEIIGAAFWTVTLGLVNLADAADGVATGYNMDINVTLAAFAVVLFVTAYFSLGKRAWAFGVTVAIGLFFVLGTLASSGLDESQAFTGILEVVAGLLAVYANFLGFLAASKST